MLVSIVNCEKSVLHGYGYYAAKATQERSASEHSPKIILARSTQWFEFAAMMMKHLRFGRISGMPAANEAEVTGPRLAQWLAAGGESPHLK